MPLYQRSYTNHHDEAPVCLVRKPAVLAPPSIRESSPHRSRRSRRSRRKDSSSTSPNTSTTSRSSSDAPTMSWTRTCSGRKDSASPGPKEDSTNKKKMGQMDSSVRSTTSYVPDVSLRDSSIRSVGSEPSDHTPTMSWARTSAMAAPAPTSQAMSSSCGSRCSKDSPPMSDDSMTNKVTGGTTSYSPRRSRTSLRKDQGEANPDPSLTESCTSFDSDTFHLLDKNQLGDQLEAAAVGGGRTSCFATGESSIPTFNSVALEGSQYFMNGSTETIVIEDEWNLANHVQELTKEAADNMSKMAKALQEEPTSAVLTEVVQARWDCFTGNLKTLFQGH